MITLVSMVFAVAGQAQAASPVVTCANFDRSSRSLEIRIVRENARDHSITVIANSRVVYRKRVAKIEVPAPGRLYYFSDEFENANRAPSTLFLQTYVEAGRLKGEFSEVSYLPVLPRVISDLSWGMPCFVGR